ncbi:PREDICTED: protein ENHANCED DISEASE RESISTANCE 4-like [Ipomoea nil]|uniref:protein ENHANCED DISEASE RESISTANCE 4-like n=1 Tax=Ipomoea nil TaxID=35883 RepID=UPI000901BD5B|nr:PREDICTED: protein ENHANCED DISEASE RESISTANCE 4-like [Ipomoea nil]XP_019184453.1 PREDICTED: protein ENHANCED DISEASE RESISTANCE 4-like [Ipomoea nil]XP_019184454.1 PREDICTED: protein ENHANCED DISEASE RESISTANCE 4-like [Ipomoea nil]XP_019184455.1 PREDICTED: protein ENHANCED DISEASE RESISTANCE 4-like [Ipomoea nil]XP_019184456.1 PREDICTED: protein ENHANCED DISEASE RESISTANCE 4-like [Ipomoea nil]XP_019184457.1 PREDICTED: protein ENHANCED DISEASE RESISTANCE 4-like [Ipomoea nil]
MGNETNTKVRLVRCPKCRQILQEYAEIPVYKCGGCGTVLQAKKKKNENACPELSTRETTHGSIERGENSLEKDISSLHQKPALSPPLDALQDENKQRNRDEYGDCNEEQRGERNFSDELQLKSRETSVPFSLPRAREHVEQVDKEKLPLDQNDRGACEIESPESSSSLARSSQFTERSHRDSKFSPGTGVNGGEGDNQNGSEGLNAVNSSRGNFSTELACDNIKTPSLGRAESISSESVVPHHEHPENSDKEIAPGFDRISSTDSLKNLLLDDKRSQHTVTHRDMSKSPATRSYYAYDGSASSCDGDDQVPNRFSQQLSGNTGFISPDEFESDYAWTVNSMLRRKSKAQHQDLNFAPVLPQMIQQLAGGSNWLESRRRFENRKSSRAMNETGSPSGYRQNVFHHRSDFNMSSTTTDREPDRTELLRMVYELEEQLHKTRLGNGNPFHDMNAPFSYNQFAPRANINYSRCPSRCGQTSRLPFPGGHLHCSAQLPRGCVHCNNGQTAACFDHNYCNAHHSSSSSPQHYTSSEYSLSVPETKSSEQRHTDQEMKKLHLREKYAKSRLVLPVASAAPIIACHYCSELLQMPSDFGLFNRRWHPVRCNACMKVLKFSVQNRIHIMPYLTETLTPPPSEIDDIRNQAPGSHYCPRPESVYYSDDSKPSFCQSEAEASSNSSPIQPPGRSMLNRKVVSPARKMKSVMNEESESKLRNSNGTSESSPPRTAPALHRLMGYPSLSQVLNQGCFE